MAVAITLVERKSNFNGGSGSGSSPMTFTSFTPAANSLLIVATTGGEPAEVHPTGFTVSGLGTWTQYLNSPWSGPYPKQCWSAIQIGASPPTGVVSVTWTSGSTHVTSYLLQVTGHDQAASLYTGGAEVWLASGNVASASLTMPATYPADGGYISLWGGNNYALTMSFGAWTGWNTLASYFDGSMTNSWVQTSIGAKPAQFGGTWSSATAQWGMGVVAVQAAPLAVSNLTALGVG